MAKLKFDLTKTLDFVEPWETPIYGIPEAAHYLRMPPATLRSWVLGRDYPTESGKKWFKPLIEIADGTHRLLSFVNLAEAHVLDACRRFHQIRMDRIRPAIDFVAEKFGSRHPLVDRQFETNGVSLFVNRYGELIDASAGGQAVMRNLVQQHLERLERAGDHIARLYPFTRPGAGETARVLFSSTRASRLEGRSWPISTSLPPQSRSDIQRASRLTIWPKTMAAKDSTSKKRSDASYARWMRQLDSVTFFVDRCLGCYDVPNALRSAGLRIEVHKDHFESRCQDDEWLRAAGQRGWVILTKDKSFRSRQVEVAALMRSAAATFVLTSANTTGAQNAAAFIAAIPRIGAFLSSFQRPFLAQITASGTVSLVLTHQMMIDLHRKLPQ